MMKMARVKWDLDIVYERIRPSRAHLLRTTFCLQMTQRSLREKETTHSIALYGHFR